MSWDEATRQSYLDAGGTVEEIDQMEAAAAERAARDTATRQRIAEQEAQANRHEVLSAAFETYHDGETDPAEIADWVERNAGRAAAEAFVEHWQADNPDPLSPSQWLDRKRADDDETARVAELIRVANAEKDEADRVAALQARADAFLERHPDAADPELEALIVASDAVAGSFAARTAGEDVDADAALEAGYVEASAKQTVGAIATEVAERSQPFRSSMMPSGVEKPSTMAERFPGIGDTQSRADRIYGQEQELVRALQAPPKTHQELQDEATAAFTRGSRTWDEGFVKTGNERTIAQARAASNAGTAGAVAARLEGGSNAAFHAASIPAAETPELLYPASQPEAKPVSTASTPRAWWLHDD